MGIQEQLQKDMVTAMKSGDRLVVDTVRFLLAQLKNARIAKSEDLKEEDVLGILSKEAKKRKEAIDLFRTGNRQDLVDREAGELDIIYRYLPMPLSTEELEAIVASAILETGAASIKDMGKVMACIMPRVKGRAEGSSVQVLVKKKLG